jgi:hypothetical protein
MPSDDRALTSYSFLVAFAKDGLLHADELAMLERIALRDGQVDEKEKTVLRHIFARAAEHGLDDTVSAEIARFRERCGI